MARSVIVQIRFAQEETEAGTIGISSLLCRKWALTEQLPLQVRLGHKETTVNLLPVRERRPIIVLSRHAQRQLSVPFPCSLHARVEGGVLRLGPVFGILSQNYAEKPPQLFRKEKNNRMFENLLHPLKDEAILSFLFNRRDIDWSTNTVVGAFLRYTPDGERVWERYTVPFPDVIYNRIQSRKIENTAELRQFKAKICTETRGKMFNPHFFSKQDIFARIDAYPGLRRYLPETRVAPTSGDIRELLQRHTAVYLKPDGGSLGQGIIKVTLDGRESYVCQFRDGSQAIRVAFEELSPFVDRYLGTARPDYLVQQGISLAAVDRSPFDLRVHLNKNRHNQWIVSGIAAKKAGMNRITTHEHNGGTIMSYTEALQSAFGSHAETMERRLKLLSLTVAAALEASLPDYIGELGIDVGIDDQGALWIFEVNSKPGRKIFNHESLQAANAPSVRLLAGYGRYLAEFSE